VTDQPAAEQIEEDKGAEDSQEIIFSLHLTQSQADLDSQLPLETILPAGEITEVKLHLRQRGRDCLTL